MWDDRSQASWALYRICLWCICIVASGLLASIVRLRRILPAYTPAAQKPPRSRRRAPTDAHVLIVLGSGGHTREMQAIIEDLNPQRYARRTYVISSGDAFSACKAHECEDSFHSRVEQRPLPEVEGKESRHDSQQHSKAMGHWQVVTVPRARKIYQPLYTTPITALRCLYDCIVLLYRCRGFHASEAAQRYPDVILTNGPGTGLIVVVASVVLKFLGAAPSSSMRVVYVESWARPNRLSLTGRLLLYSGACTKFIVQWERQALSINEAGHNTRVEYHDFIMGSQT